MYKVGDIVKIGNDLGVIIHVNQMNSQPLIFELNTKCIRWWTWKSIGEVLGHMDIYSTLTNEINHVLNFKEG